MPVLPLSKVERIVLNEVCAASRGRASMADLASVLRTTPQWESRNAKHAGWMSLWRCKVFGVN